MLMINLLLNILVDILPSYVILLCRFVVGSSNTMQYYNSNKQRQFMTCVSKRLIFCIVAFMKISLVIMKQLHYCMFAYCLNSYYNCNCDVIYKHEISAIHNFANLVRQIIYVFVFIVETASLNMKLHFKNQH